MANRTSLFCCQLYSSWALVSLRNGGNHLSLPNIKRYFFPEMSVSSKYILWVWRKSWRALIIPESGEQPGKPLSSESNNSIWQIWQKSALNLPPESTGLCQAIQQSRRCQFLCPKTTKIKWYYELFSTASYCEYHKYNTVSPVWDRTVQVFHYKPFTSWYIIVISIMTSTGCFQIHWWAI